MDNHKYDPTDPDDPLRHRFLDRKPPENRRTVMPIEQKIANGLNVSEIIGEGVHVEHVPLSIRKRLARTLGIGA